jgi:hypothetical protein
MTESHIVFGAGIASTPMEAWLPPHSSQNFGLCAPISARTIGSRYAVMNGSIGLGSSGPWIFAMVCSTISISDDYVAFHRHIDHEDDCPNFEAQP